MGRQRADDVRAEYRGELRGPITVAKTKKGLRLTGKVVPHKIDKRTGVDPVGSTLVPLNFQVTLKVFTLLFMARTVDTAGESCNQKLTRIQRYAPH